MKEEIIINKVLVKSILQSLKENIQPRHENYDVEEREWTLTAKYLKDNGYIKSITISKNTKYMFAEITEYGELYLNRL